MANRISPSCIPEMVYVDNKTRRYLKQICDKSSRFLSLHNHSLFVDTAVQHLLYTDLKQVTGVFYSLTHICFFLPQSIGSSTKRGHQVYTTIASIAQHSSPLPNLRQQQEQKHRSQESRVHQSKNGHLSKRNNGPPHLHLSHKQPNNIIRPSYPTATQTQVVPTLFFSQNLDSKLYSLRQ